MSDLMIKKPDTTLSEDWAWGWLHGFREIRVKQDQINFDFQIFRKKCIGFAHRFKHLPPEVAYVTQEEEKFYKQFDSDDCNFNYAWNEEDEAGSDE
jgi:hypothetical protein